MEKELEKVREYCQNHALRDALKIPYDAMVPVSNLAQGEYHKNYVFSHPIDGKKYVLRVNYGSQMHLDHQITYEYNALKMLEKSKRTPKVYFVDDSKQSLGNGVLVMEYLAGRPLDYKRDLQNGISCLADVHSCAVKEPKRLIQIETPIMGILAECEQMLQVYRNSPYKDVKVLAYIDHLMKLAYKKAETLKATAYQNVCINTELNNHNFIVDDENDRTYLIDWEKPLWGDMAQDLGHMLAPTTTFWKTDEMLSGEEIDTCIREYERSVDGRIQVGNVYDRVQVFLPVTCLRGITWCAMAYHEYQNPNREIVNMETYEKLKAYLNMPFLEHIEKVITKC